MLPPGSRGSHAAACGDVPPPRGGGFLYPLLRLPLIFRLAAQRSIRG